jgi:predicted O-methyltransferase YrrM
MSKYLYTTTWFLGSELRKLMHLYVDGTKPLNILEIGCFEGLATSQFSDELLLHPDSRLFAVDPFDLGDTTTPLTVETEKLFLRNIHRSEHASKICVYKGFSDEFFKVNKQMFDFVYIDGSHIPDQVLRDVVNSFNFTKKEGIIWMDDYDANNELRSTIDKFLDANADNVEVVHRGYQIGFRKLVDTLL